MEVPHSLTLNEAALQQLPDDKKPHFIFEWLRFLDKVLVAADKSDIKSCQQKLVAQLVNLLRENLGAPSRSLLARCLATLFSVGDTFLLFDTVNKCNDIIKVKDDSPSYLSTRLAAICCLGSMYEKLGRMMGRSYEDTVSTLVKSLKSSESQTRLEIMVTLEKICVGMGTAAPVALREVSRAARSTLISDRSNAVRAAAAHCLRQMLPLMKLTPADLDTVATACLRAAQTSDYRVRCAVAEFLGALVAATQAAESTNTTVKGKTVQQSKKDAAKNVVSLDEALNLLMGAFLRGGSSFLKGEIIKSGSGVSREVRVCITNAYVIFVQNMGGVWLERNMRTFLTHVLDLVANPKAASSHVDAVYSRKCINYILRNTLGKMLGEKAQASACKEIVLIVAKQMNSIDFNPENAKDCNQETLFSQHLLVCALTETGELALQLGTSVQNLATDTSLKMIDAVCSVLEHPCTAARLAAAQCLRCICIALPSQITPLLDRCLLALEQTLHISGYSAAVAAILGAVSQSPLGAPHGRGKIAFNAAEQLLRSAGQSSRLTSAKTNAGWLIVGAICTLGVPVVRGLLPRMLLLWRNSFPRSAKELESEKARGDAFTWQVTLENRAGALSALHSLLVHCPALAHGEDTYKRLCHPIEGSIAVLANTGEIARSFGGSLCAPMALLRLRTYLACGALLAAAAGSGGGGGGGGGATSGSGATSGLAATPALLRLLAAECRDATAANTPTGLLRSAMHPRDTVLLDEASWIYDTDHADIEEQLIHPWSAACCSALEHEPCGLYAVVAARPLGVAVIDAAIKLLPALFTATSSKHRQQMLEHFAECIKAAKGKNQECAQINVLTVLLLSLRTLAETKSSLGTQAAKQCATEIIFSGLSATSPLVRAAAASCIGRLCSCITEAESHALNERVIALARTSPNKSVKAAAAAAISSVQRARGTMSNAQALPILRALAQDSTSIELQIWAVHACTVLVDASGPMFRCHVDATTSLALSLLFSIPPHAELAHRCLGSLVSALITVVGPELQGALVARFACACAALPPSARSEAIGCLQQLHMFSPNNINLHTLIDSLAKDLSSPELSIRRAALCCIRQLSQKEANELSRYVRTNQDSSYTKPYTGVVITEAGLLAGLFALLDIERDADILSYTKDTLTCCLLASTSIRDWLQLCKKVLTDKLEDSSNTEVDFDEDDDQVEFHAESEQTTHPPVPPRWPTRVFAMECIQKLMTACEASGEPAHFDLIKAKEKQLINPNGSYLSLFVSELVRMSFVSATSESDALRLSGLHTLQMIIRMFARAAEPDFPGHLLLEQYMAQVGAALRPAFSPETAAHVTAAACDVCSTWIGCGVARDINHRTRVHQLLVSSLDKLNTKGNTTLIYNESMATLEKLSILKAWAEIYIVAMVSNGSAPCSHIKQLDKKPINNQTELIKWRNQLLQSNSQVDNTLEDDCDSDFGEFESKGESLLKLVEPELDNLGANWLAALKDHALLSLPPEFASQLPHGGGAFYSAETAEASRTHYAAAWPSVLYAAALRYNAQCATPGTHHENKEEAVEKVRTESSAEFYEPMDERFHLIFGICMEALCSQRDSPTETSVTVLLSLVTLLHAPENRTRLISDRSLAIEVCQILHRQALTQESVEALLLAVDALQLLILAAKEHTDSCIAAKIEELAPTTEPSTPSTLPPSLAEAVHSVSEGGPTGDLPPAKSLVFACLEAATAFIVRRLPALNPVKGDDGKVGVIGVAKGLGVHGDTLLIHSLNCLSMLPSCTSPQGALSILPTILYMATGVLKESKDNAVLAEAAILLLQMAAECKTVRVQEDTKKQFEELLQSTLGHLVDLVKNDDPEHRINATQGGRAMAVLLGHVEGHCALHYPCINHFRLLIDSPDVEKFTAACHIIASIWRSAPTGLTLSWWARALAPKVLAHAAANQVANVQRSKAAIAAVTAADQLVEAASDDIRIKLLWLLIPIVVSYLGRGAAPAHKILHEFALNWLTKIGPKYPQEFKTMMSQSPELRTKLEEAVKASQQSGKPRTSVAQRPVFESRPAKPIIQLKTDFSDFR